MAAELNVVLSLDGPQNTKYLLSGSGHNVYPESGQLSLLQRTQ